MKWLIIIVKAYFVAFIILFWVLTGRALGGHNTKITELEERIMQLEKLEQELKK